MLGPVSRLNIHRSQEVPQRVRESGILTGGLDVPLNAASCVHVVSRAPVNVAFPMMRVYLVTTVHAVAAHETEPSGLVFRQVLKPHGEILGELQALSHERSESMVPVE